MNLVKRTFLFLVSLYRVSCDTNGVDDDDSLATGATCSSSAYFYNEVPENERTIYNDTHERISFIGDPGYTLGNTNDDLIIRYKRNDSDDPNQVTIHDIEGVPQYFSDIRDKFIEKEVEYRFHHGHWSEQVLLEKLYFGLLFGRSGYPAHYYLGDEQHGSEKPYTRKLERASGWSPNIFRRTTDICTLSGIYCRDGKVIKIILPSYNLGGTLTDDIQYLTDLEVLNLADNDVVGTIPPTIGALTNLKVLILSDNAFAGSLPPSLFASMSNLEKIFLDDNNLTGTLPESLFSHSPHITVLDVSRNEFIGSIPESYGIDARNLVDLRVGENTLNGQLPSQTDGLGYLESFKAEDNRLSGTIPTKWMQLSRLQDFLVAQNVMTGTIPSEVVGMSSLRILGLSSNRFSGTIPSPEGEEARLFNLTILDLKGNKFSGTIPPTLFTENNTFELLDISSNDFHGSLPGEIGRLTRLHTLHGQHNRFTGTLPSTMARLMPSLDLNLTANFLTGTVPKKFCGGEANSHNLLFRQFGCDAVLCPPGTFSPSGAATMDYGCRPCMDSSTKSPSLNNALGRINCPHVPFIHGDLDGDGKLSDREVLRLLWVYTSGSNWGAQYLKWGDIGTGACLLNGITCSESGEITKIDLSSATLCSDGGRQPKASIFCRGIPSEIGLLESLKILLFNSQKFLRTTLPTEIGRLSKLQYFDIGASHLVSGPIPATIGGMSSLKVLNLAGCRLNGTVPSELYKLTNLEKLHLSLNPFSGTISQAITKLVKLKELMWSRAAMSGTIPNDLGAMTALENLELYGNKLRGTIPPSIGKCSNLRRIDIFNNDLTGPLPESLAHLSALQILHVKSNLLTGTIHPGFGNLPFLTWFDLSTNHFHGTIPETFGSSRSLKDFRLGGNMIHGPISRKICVNTNINGGLTRTYGCDGVICPLGTYSDPGHAQIGIGCKACPEGETTLYLGASECEVISDLDILAIYFNVMYGGATNDIQRNQWADPEEDDWCAWRGVSCDTRGEISSIRFPLYGLDDPNLYF